MKRNLFFAGLFAMIIMSIISCEEEHGPLYGTWIFADTNRVIEFTDTHMIINGAFEDSVEYTYDGENLNYYNPGTGRQTVKCIKDGNELWIEEAGKVTVGQKTR